MAHNIERTYHDVTTLDSRSALTKIKDIMDISSGAEFFSVSKDSTSPIAVKPLVFNSSHTDFKYYLKPGEKYTIGREYRHTRMMAQPISGDIYLRMHVKLEDIDLDYFDFNENLSKEWYEEKKSILKKIDEIIIYGKSGSNSYHIYLRNSDNTRNIYSTSSHGISRSKFDIGMDDDRVIYGEYGANDDRIGSITSFYDFICDLDATLLGTLDMKSILKFTLLYVTDEDDSKFDAEDVRKVLNRLITHSSDSADTLYLSQAIDNRYTVSISNVTTDGTRLNAVFRELLPKLPNYVGRSLREANNGVYEDLIETIARDLFDDDLFIDDEYIGESMLWDGSKYGGKFDLGDIRSSILHFTEYDKKLATQSELVLFSDVTYGTAHVIKSLIEALDGGVVSIYAHSSRQLFKDVTLTSITHPVGTQLIIGNDNFLISDTSYDAVVRREENRISIVNDTEFNWNSIYDVDTLNATNFIVSNGTINEDLTVTNDLSVYGDALFNSDVTVNGDLSLDTITISSIADSSYNSNNVNTPFKIVSVDENGQLILTGVQFVPGATNGNITFLNKEGAFSTFNSSFLTDTLGVAALTHSHGGLLNNGTFATPTSITNGTTSFRMVVTDETGVIRQSNIGFDRTNIYTDGTNTTPNRTLSSPNSYFLSKGGDWKSLYDVLFRGATTNLNSATELGIYTFEAEAPHNPTALYDNRKAADTTNNIKYGGILYVLRTSSEISGDIIQLAYIPTTSLTLTDGTNYNYPNPEHSHERMYMRVASVQSGDWSFGDWIYFSQYDHNHDSKYVKIDGAKVKDSIKILSTVAEADTTDLSADSTDYYEIKHTGSGNTQNYDHTVRLKNSSHNPYFRFIIKDTNDNPSTSLSVGKSDATLNVDLIVNDDVTVKGTAAGTKNIKFFKTTNTYIGGNLYMRPAAATATVSNVNTDVYGISNDNGDGASLGKVLFLTNDYESHNGQGQIKESNVGVEKLRYISGLTSSAQDQIDTIAGDLRKHKHGASTDTVEAAHGNIKSDGSFDTTSTVDIANNDMLLIVDNSDSSKIKATSIKFDGTSTTTYLSKKGTWQALPGDAAYSNNTYTGGFISSTDYQHLVTLWNAYGSDNESDTTVNKIQEVLAAFADYSETNGTLEERYYKKSGGDISGNVGIAGTLTLTGDSKDIEVQKGLIKVTGSSKVFTGVSNAGSSDINGTVIYSNAITFRDPSTNNANDGAWVKFREATADSGSLEIATNNNGNEPIYFRGYNAGVLAYQFQVPTDETSGTLASRKYAEDYNGVEHITTSGTGISHNDTTAANVHTSHDVQITLDSSSAGNAAANKVVLRNAAGSIQSEKYAISSGTTTKATMQYNSSEDCIDFIFA